MVQLPEKNQSTPGPGQVEQRQVHEAEAGQRLDNYLMRIRSGVPKGRIYRAIRTGEVRVNKGRAKPELKLSSGDIVRVPPLKSSEASVKPITRMWQQRLQQATVMETPTLIAIDKPSGLAVHGGSGVDVGLIEALRSLYCDDTYLELVHRLDRDTSGLILIARRAATLRSLHALLRSGDVDKRYQCLVAGRWPSHLKRIEAPLEKFVLPSGERRVRVSQNGKAASTGFRVLRRWDGVTLLEAKPITGRTHQIRVHCQHAGFPILGDAKYADNAAGALASGIALERLFLHAHTLTFELDQQLFSLRAELAGELQAALDRL